MSKYFIAIYTHKVKQYCDQQFFRALGEATRGVDCMISILDNTPGTAYFDRLKKHMEDWLGHESFVVRHIDIEYMPRETLFLRSVCDSVNFLRDIFLKTKAKYFVIFESDVIIPKNTFELFAQAEDKADIIGGIYYTGFHNPILFNPHAIDLVESKHVLSGCTMYSREVITKIPFRWNPENKAEFPDSWISVDAGVAGYKLANYAAIKCLHIENQMGGRGMDNI